MTDSYNINSNNLNHHNNNNINNIVNTSNIINYFSCSSSSINSCQTSTMQNQDIINNSSQIGVVASDGDSSKSPVTVTKSTSSFMNKRKFGLTINLENNSDTDKIDSTNIFIVDSSNKDELQQQSLSPNTIISQQQSSRSPNNLHLSPNSFSLVNNNQQQFFTTFVTVELTETRIFQSGNTLAASFTAECIPSSPSSSSPKICKLPNTNNTSNATPTSPSCAPTIPWEFSQNSNTSIPLSTANLIIDQ
ncbi:hypothetical protein PPL_01498 [Heterostelium album PN500]|uniref:Uncharacterized protein n=1 Tax=Heterostelium pallidum (strain ATCC 26659 / Pp 5 / PN500) TaxID=670386 RepID=D3AZF7_HETP5|nr:hypothetical protein PPL_01498 [Heterostelium album PN500]EFA85540.1 hypothetical protein PPL_01498 [Heterostelium album PN500]|eukprot:XP_020437648.1 hypothetical protein PPL_01498 [Heterostelium album PN500]